MQLHGSARLTLGKTSHAAAITVDLDLNQITVEFARPDRPNTEALLVLGDHDYTALTDLLIHSPYGSLRLSKVEDWHVVQANWNFRDERGTDPFSRRSLVSQIVLRPGRSVLRFQRDALEVPGGDQYEVILQSGADIPKFQGAFDLSGRTVQIVATGSVVSVSSDAAFTQLERDSIRAGLGIACSGPVTMRSSITPIHIDITTSPHTLGSSGRFWLNDADAERTIVSLILLLQEDASHNEPVKIGAALFHALGLKNEGLLEERIISLFIELEMLDGRRTLDKHSTALLLGIDNTEADFLHRVRNALVHKGRSLPAACVDARNELKSFGQTPPCYTNGAFRPPVAYFRLAGLLNRYWARLARLTHYESYFVHSGVPLLP